MKLGKQKKLIIVLSLVFLLTFSVFTSWADEQNTGKHGLGAVQPQASPPFQHQWTIVN